MSSHHFVKEGQEPALIIVDALGLELTEPLLEWVPLVIVLDEIIEEVKTWGIKIDVVICSSMSEDKLNDLLSDQFPLQVILCKEGETPLATALIFLTKTNQPGVNLLMNLGDDDRITLLEQFPQLKMNVITRHEKWLLCQRDFEKWVPAQSRFMLRMTQANQPLGLEGFSMEGMQVTALADGSCSIRSSAPFWVGDSLC